MRRVRSIRSFGSRKDSNSELQNAPSFTCSDEPVYKSSSVDKVIDGHGLARSSKFSPVRMASSPEDFESSCLSSSPPDALTQVNGVSIGSSCHTHNTDLTMISLQSAPPTHSRFRLGLKGRQCFDSGEPASPKSMTDNAASDTHTHTRTQTHASSNDRRKAKRAHYLSAMADDLIGGVAELFMLEQRTCPSLSFDLMKKWNDKLSDTTCSPHIREVTCEEARDAVRNFVTTLPVRYPVGIYSPAEVLVHMRFLAEIRNDPMNPVVHINTLDDEEELKRDRRLAFCPTLNGMCNLKVITIACAHTIGLMEMVMGSLVTGGSEILETDYLLSSEKMMLITCIVNVKGPIRLEELEEKIALYLKAARGLISNSMVALETIIPGKIGAPVDKERVEHAAIPRSETIQDGLDRADLTKTEVDFESPLLLSEMLGQNETDHGNRKHLRRRGSSFDLGPAIDRASSTITKECEENGGTSSQSILHHGFFGDVNVSGIVKRGSGGVVVYRGFRSKNLNGESNVVIKIVECKAERDISSLKELQREGNMAKGLRHKNICELIDMIATPDFVCLSYEYCSKGNLSVILNDPDITYDYLNLAQDISNGMAYLHAKNIIHRDLKPDNIFITQDNRAKIADFGLSITDTGGHDMTGETGTYRWMAPEVIRHEPYSINSDIYSFGLVLWQLVTNSPRPFTTKSPIQTAFAVAKGERPEIPSFVSDFIARIIKSCWDHDQLRRPSFAFCSIALAQYSRAAILNAEELNFSIHSAGDGCQRISIY